MASIEERLKARQQGSTIPQSSGVGSSIEERLKKRKASLPSPVQEEKPWWEKTAEEVANIPGKIGQSFIERGQKILGAIEGTEDFAQETGGTPLAYGVSGLRTAGKIGSQVAGGVGDIIGTTISPFIPTPVKEKIGEFTGEVEKAGKGAIANLPVSERAKQEITEGTGDIINLTGLLGGAKIAPAVEKTTIGAGKQIARETIAGAKKVADVTGKTIEGAGTTIKGVAQAGQEFGARIPRVITKAGESIEESAKKAERIKISTPAVKEAIKVNLDDKIINTVSQADTPTKKAYKRAVEIAEEAPTTLGVKKQPTIVGGDLAVKQYELIDNAKKEVGKKIGEKIKQLSKTEKIDVSDRIANIDNILSSQGVIGSVDKLGKVKLDFSGSKFTPAERTRIEQLYNLASEGGNSLSPAQIKSKDQLFSKLQRESNMEGIGKIIVETPEGNKSLFQVFRDAYNSKLDEISPELRELNKQYSDYSRITDDIEDSILKTPNFNITKSADQGEFAKVNLRRIFGEAQSSPVYEAVADEMDRVARKLGYADATPKQIILFAQELRKLYPEIIPETGFAGGIKSGISGGIPGVLDYATQFGKATVVDQRKALKKLLEEYVSIPKKKK